MSRQGVMLVGGDQPFARLHAAPDGPPAYLALGLVAPRARTHIRIGMEARTEGIVAGDEYWQRRELIVPIGAETAGYRIVIANVGRAGALLVRNPTIELVHETGVFAALRLCLIAVWGATCLWVLAPLARRRMLRPAGLATIGFAAVIVAGALTPQPTLSDVMRLFFGEGIKFAASVIDIATGTNPQPERSVAPQAESGPATPDARGDSGRPPDRRASPGPVPSQIQPTTNGYDPRDAATTVERLTRTISPLGSGPLPHLVAFALLAFATAFGARELFVATKFGLLVLFALVTEVLQIFYFTRTFEIPDLLANSAGIAAGLLAGWSWLAIFGLRRASRA